MVARYVKIRRKDPKLFKPFKLRGSKPPKMVNFVTKDVGRKGHTLLILGKLKGEDTLSIQAYRLDKKDVKGAINPTNLMKTDLGKTHLIKAALDYGRWKAEKLSPKVYGKQSELNVKAGDQLIQVKWSE